jgi:hypothetical protein
MLSWALTAAFLLAGSPAPSCFPPTALVDPFLVKWYCAQLAAADEGLFTADPGYRFAWIPSFHPARVVVVRGEAGHFVVIGKVLSGKGGYAPGRLERSTKRTLTSEEWRLLDQRMANAGLWEAPDEDNQRGADGAEWIVEGRREKRYQFRSAWSPEDSSFPQYRKACEYMLSLAGIHPGAGELY